MSDKVKLIYNCGASHISASVFKQEGDSLVLQSYQIRELNFDTSKNDLWLNSVIAVMADISKTSPSYKGRATVILPGHLLLTKPIKIPLVDVSRQTQIIAFEAQQSIPYPLSEVEWGSQVISDDGVETEVLLAAIKSDLAMSFSRQIMALGIMPDWVSASSVLDYNTYMHAYPGSQEDSLIINVGARSSNLIFVNRDGFFIRNISLGGNTLTMNIAESLSCSPLDAERAKIQHFFEPEASGEMASEIDQATQSFMSRLNQEVTRSIVTYRQQKRGGSPQLILLTGKGSMLPDLSSYLSEKQKVSVDYFDCMSRVGLGGGVDAEAIQIDKYQLNEVVGAACGDLISSSVGINLMPKALKEELAFAKKKPFLFLAATLLALAFLPPIFKFSESQALLDTKIEQATAQLRALEDTQLELEEAMDDALSVDQRIKGIEGLVNSKYNWVNFFSSIANRLHVIEDVWLETLKVNRSLSEEVTEDTDAVATAYSVVVKGRLLIRQDADADASVLTAGIQSRINRLVAGFNESKFIDRYSDLKIDFNPIRSGLKLVPFEVTLHVDPRKPL